MKKVAVIGAGSWGSALALVLARKGIDINLWCRNQKQRNEIRLTGENKKYLPGIEFPKNIFLKDSVQETLDGVEAIVMGVPTQSFRDTLDSIKEFITSEMILINVAKGIEQKTLLRLSEVANQIIPNIRYVVLSGPSHAEEVAKNLPTTVTMSSKNMEDAETIQKLFFTDRFRTYTTDDMVAVEVAGAIKNVIALVAGVSDGLGFGDNSKAAIMTRGLAEMVRLGVALGAEKESFLGLAGVGDLIVTCTSMHSRNRRCGIALGKGLSVEEAKKEIGMVVEGLSTAVAIKHLADKLNVSMPIVDSASNVINGLETSEEAAERLLKREMKNEAV
ncbi:MAG: NAD(P)-dependent glycerol-3-phosphate dehydrogenase [Eubacteriales bacterium]|nr:NAD(P)-dependent glycerol-3-phosphate dehydrogenase [Eubacteriales bacterium]MDY3332403.1 NAD(P)H-dependent glycerol-3-phosphate dehydrogenase [Gallibacter sp.]